MLTAAVSGFGGGIVFLVIWGALGIVSWNDKRRREEKREAEERSTNIALMRATGQYPDGEKRQG